MLVPDAFARAMAEVHGAAGATWVARLPALVSGQAERWSLRVGEPFLPLSYNFVTRVVRGDGTQAVLKIGFPCEELSTEIEALRAFDGHGAVRLLEVEEVQGALLLERLEPGTPLDLAADEDGATAAAASVMHRLWRPAPVGNRFPSIADWCSGLGRLRARFDGGTGPFPRSLVERAEGLFRDLLASAGAPVLLHGDLHHGNVLADGTGWRAIDPKGVVGEPAYEVGALLRNPLPGILSTPRVLSRRIDLLAELLDMDRARIRDWGCTQAVLSAWWSFEDHGRGWEDALACAELLVRATGT